MNQNCMITREAALEFGLSFQNTYTERPFRDQNWHHGAATPKGGLLLSVLAVLVISVKPLADIT